MPVKRTRMGRSSASIGDTKVVSPSPPRPSGKVSATGNSAKAMKASVEEDLSGETRFGILTVSSPVKGVEVAGPGSGFLEKCCGCKKEIGEHAEVFMYSYLRAFCSVECRERQIFIDNVAEVVSTASKRRNG